MDQKPVNGSSVTTRASFARSENGKRHSMQFEPSARERFVRISTTAHEARQSTGNLRSHVRRSSKDIILSSFRSVARRLSRTASSTQPRGSALVDATLPLPSLLHNASTAPEPVLGVSPLKGAGEIDSDIDHMSDTLSEKYPSPNEKGNLGAETKSNFPILVVQTLSKYIFLEDEKGAELALRSLRNLSLDTTAHNLLTKAGSLRAALSAMERFTTNVEIQSLGLLFLGDMSRGSLVNKQYIGQNGGLQLINKLLLDSQMADVRLLVRACITLRTVCAGSNFNAVLSGVCGTVEAVLKTMRRWKRCANLQERCLDVLTTIVHDAPENASMVMDAGAPSEVLSTIRQYGKEIDVQVSALRAACEIIRSSEAARDDMGEAGLIGDLQRGLQTFSENSEYTTSAARCVRYLTFSAGNRKRVTRSMLPMMLVERLNKWYEDRRVVAAVLQALANVAFDDEVGKEGVVRGRGTDALLNILDEFANDAAICEAACRVLRNASDGNMTTKRLVGRHGVVNRVASTLRTHSGRAGVQEHGCATLINLWETHEAQIRFVEIDSHLARVSHCYTSNEDLQKQVEGLRLRLARPSSVRSRGAFLCLMTSSDKRYIDPEDTTPVEKRGSVLNTKTEGGSAATLFRDAVAGAETSPRGEMLMNY